MQKTFTTVMLLLFICVSKPVFGQTSVRYDLYLTDTTVNFSGESAPAIAINGQTPGPTLTFTEGDTALIYVHNKLKVESSIHWHGLILPNVQDGVPYLTTEPIQPDSTHLYQFPLLQHGTYWYHSHSGLQEQNGLSGALIIHKRHQDKIPEYTVLLSDWTNEDPSEVLRSLHMANDWYSIEKHSTQNWGEALISGHFGDKANQEWLRMPAMDVSDVYYNAFLTNGAIAQHLPKLEAGTKIKLRIINGSSSTYFWLQYAGSKITVVASDGKDVDPVEVDRMIIGVAETYDVIVTVPQDMSYEFKATAEDRTNSTSLWLGDGMKMPAPTLPPLNYFAGMRMMNSMMHLDGSMNPMGMKMNDQRMDMNEVMYPELSDQAPASETSPLDTTAEMASMPGMNMSNSGDLVTLNYGMLRAPMQTTLPNAPLRVLRFNLTGNMNRYQWSINNTALSDTDKILIQKGENVRIILNNQTMMRHPMHLHGHFFRVLNGAGAYAPLKNVIDVMPMETDTIEFAAQYDGDWFFHCHILYHMMSGMGRVFHYANSAPNPEVERIPDAWQMFLGDDNMWDFSTTLAAQSQAVFAKAIYMDRDYMFDATGSINYHGGFESETHFARFIDRQQFLKVFLGTDIRSLRETTSSSVATVEKRTVATFGVQYLLPLFLQTELRVDHTGRFRFQVSRNDMAITSRLRLDAMWNTDKEYEVGFHYILTKRFALSANYDSHFGAGAGLLFTY